MESNIIEIPVDVDEMRVRHLPFLLLLNEFDRNNPKIEDIVEMNAVFTGIPRRTLGRYKPKDNINLFNNVVKAFDTYTPKEIPLSITYKNEDGVDVKYNFVHDFTALPVDWFIDMTDADFESNPIDVMAFCFIEDGLSYGEPDQHENVINPRSRRNEVFKKNVPLSLLLDVQGFFLLSWNVFLKLQANKVKEEKRKRKKSKN